VNWKFLLMGPLLGRCWVCCWRGGANGQSLDLDKQGLVLRNAAGQELQRLPLRAKRWDQRALPDGKQVAAVLQDADSGALHLIESDGRRLRERLRFCWRRPSSTSEPVPVPRRPRPAAGRAAGR
jgi:hypothetical protein